MTESAGTTPTLKLEPERLAAAIALHRNHYFRGPGTLLWHTCFEGCAAHIVECYADPRLAAALAPTEPVG